MSRKNPNNLAASVRQRLLNQARAEGRAFQEFATLYAMERFLFRLGRSRYAESFVLKGGLMTLTWAGEHGRVTRDIDLLGWGPNSVEAVVERVRGVLEVTTQDGLVFDRETVQGDEIRANAAYVGVRVTFKADLAGMTLHLQVDVGFGDAIEPPPQWVDYPQLLDLGAPRVLGYPAEATLAEKLHAIVDLGLANSRLKDYYDLRTAHRLGVTTSETLGAALRHTFSRRGTPLPESRPEGLSTLFADDLSRQKQWRAFLRKSKLTAPELEQVVEEIWEMAALALEAARS